MKQWSYVIANAGFMLDNINSEQFPEVLRERRRFYNEQKKPRDFWLVPEPAFLELMPDVAKKLKRPCVALISTEKEWIT